LCKRLPEAPRAKTSMVPGRLLHATGALVRPIGTPTVPNQAAGDPIDSNPPHSVPLSVPWSNSPSGPRATSWISPGPVAHAPTVDGLRGGLALGGRGWSEFPRRTPICAAERPPTRQRLAVSRSLPCGRRGCRDAHRHPDAERPPRAHLRLVLVLHRTTQRDAG